MKITCISASNTRSIGDNSASTRVCGLIKKMVRSADDSISVDIVALVDHEIRPCILCGGCFQKDGCVDDLAFNGLFAKLADSEGIFLVIPHYACIPSKLSIIFEKLNEIFFVNAFNNRHYNFPLSGKPVGIIVHGGAVDSDDSLRHYKAMLLDPAAYVLQSLCLDVTGVNEQWQNGVAFGLRTADCIKKVKGSLFPAIEQDWNHISDRIAPLVAKVIEKVKRRNA